MRSLGKPQWSRFRRRQLIQHSLSSSVSRGSPHLTQRRHLKTWFKRDSSKSSDHTFSDGGSDMNIREISEESSSSGSKRSYPMIEVKEKRGKSKNSLNSLLPSRVWTWGWGCHGALGHGDYEDSGGPKPVRFCDQMAMATVRESTRLEDCIDDGSAHLLDTGGSTVDISCGWAHSMVLDSSGHVFRFGWIDDIKTIYSSANLKANAPDILIKLQKFAQRSRLGWVLHDSGTKEPTLVMDLKEVSVAKAVCGAGTNYVLSNDGRVYSWGTGRWGQLGHKVYNNYTEEFPRPKVVERLLGHRIVDLDCGYVHALFLDDSGCLWTCGTGQNGRLGLGVASRLTEMPIPRPHTPLWKQYLKTQHLKHDAFQFVTDSSSATQQLIERNAFKQLTDDSNGSSDGNSQNEQQSNNNESANDCTAVGKLKKQKSPDVMLYDEIDVNVYYDEQKVHALEQQSEADWENNGDNELVRAKDVVGYDIPEIYKMSCGHKHSALLTRDGKVYCYGCGNTGAIGRGPRDFSDCYWPSAVELGGLSQQFVVDVVCGQHHTVALTADGHIYTWGMGRHSQCGRTRAQAFMLEDIRERGANLTTVRHRAPYRLQDDDQSANPMAALSTRSGVGGDRDASVEFGVDPDDGILLKGDPLAMSPGKLQNFPKNLKPWRIFAGFYQTTVVTHCGKAVIYGDELQRLENEPTPYILSLPQKIVKVCHGWKHHMVLTANDEQFEAIRDRDLAERSAFGTRSNDSQHEDDY